MKIALIGASGFVGSAVLTELKNRGHQITAISRHPEKIVTSSKVSSVKADAFNEEEISQIVKGHDIVVSAYNPGWTNPDIGNEILKGAKSIQNGVKKSGVKRLFVVGGAGSLYVAPNIQLVDTPEFPAAYKTAASALRDYYNYLKEEKELEWTFLSPAVEMHPGTSGERKGTYRTGLDSPIFQENGRSVISVEDLAVAIADEVENPKFLKKRFTVAY